MAVLYPNPCYNEVCYKGTVLYLFIISEAFVAGRVIVLVNIKTIIFIFIPMAHSWNKYLRNEFNFWNVHGIMNTSSLL